MTVHRDVRLSLAAQRRTERIRALEAWNDLLLQNAVQIDMYSYGQSKRALIEIPNSGSQLSLWSENDPLSER